MNSSQRRRLQRGFPHTIKLEATSRHPYYGHDEKIEDARSWCKKKFKYEYRIITGWDHTEFKFTNEGDAVIFALKWL